MELRIRLGFKVLYILIVFLFHHVIYGVKVIPIRERDRERKYTAVLQPSIGRWPCEWMGNVNQHSQG